MNIQIFGKSKCFDTKKAERWFKERRIRFQSIDLGKVGISPGELKSRGCDGTRLLAILQADALVDDRSFRCDEKALQLVETLRALVPELIIQTAVSERFDGSKTLESLLAERREFNFPPFSRMVEIRSEADGEARARHFLKRDAQLGRNKRRILADLPRDCYPDVDPA